MILRKQAHSIAAVCLVLFLTQTAKADRFEKIMRTEEFISAYRSIKNFSPELPEWVHPESPYGSLFTTEGEREKIFSWMPSEEDGLDVKGTRFREKHDFIYASRDYRLPDKTVVTLTYLIPHPGSFALVDQGLIPEFRHARPDPTLILAKERFNQKGLDFDLYQLTDKDVVVMTELPQKVLVSYKIESYVKVPQLRRFMESISYDRMIETLKQTGIE